MFIFRVISNNDDNKYQYSLSCANLAMKFNWSIIILEISTKHNFFLIIKTKKIKNCCKRVIPNRKLMI
jgi:hypothetical protein